MASVGSIGNSNDTSSLSIYLKELQEARAKQTDGTGKAASPSGDLLQALSGSAGKVQGPQLPPGLKDKLSAAVQQTVANLDPSSSFADVLKAVHDTIDKTLKENGVDPATVKKHGHHGHHKPAAATDSGEEQESADLLKLLQEIFSNSSTAASGKKDDSQDLFSTLSSKSDAGTTPGAANASASAKLLELLKSLPNGFNLDTHA